MGKVLANEHEDYGKFTLLTFVIPMVGFILGIVYLTKPDQLDRKLGEHLIVVSILFSILWVILLFIAAPDMPIILV